jgi:O-succinylbenzoate synthase
VACKSVRELERVGPVHIGSVDVFAVSVPMHEPFRISSGVVERKDATLLRIQSGEYFGWGESSAMPGAFYSADTPASCQAQLLQTLPHLVGKSFETMRALEAWLLERGLSPFVRVAVETAAWELLAREEGVSVRKLFGLPELDVPTGLAVGLYPTLEELKAALVRYRPLDYARLKIKIKRGQDVALVRAVREGYGEIPLFVDANADYGAADLDIFHELDRYGLMMFEQPFAKSDLETSSTLQQSVKTPLCFDEGIESAADVHAAAQCDAMRIVNIKLQRVGGFLEAFRILEACSTYNIPFWMGTMPELGVGSAQALILASHPACRFPTDVEPSDRWYEGDVLAPRLEMKAGTLSVPAGPGLGFTIDEEQLRRFTLQRWSF